MPTDLGPPVLGPPVLGPLRAVKLVVCDVDGTLTDGVIGMNVHGEEFKNFSVLDGMGINWLLRAGIGVAFLSARKSAIVEKRAAELGVENCWSGVSEKLSHLEAFLEKNGLDWKEVCFVGDDLNDFAVAAPFANGSRGVVMIYFGVDTGQVSAEPDVTISGTDASKSVRSWPVARLSGGLGLEASPVVIYR